MPLYNFCTEGFGFVHHSIAILYHEVPNPNITTRNFFNAAWDAASELPASRGEGNTQCTEATSLTLGAAAGLTHGSGAGTALQEGSGHGAGVQAGGHFGLPDVGHRREELRGGPDV